MSYPRYLGEATAGQGEEAWDGNTYQHTVLASPFNLQLTMSPSSHQLWAQQHTATTTMGYPHQTYHPTTQAGYSPTFQPYSPTYLPHPANPYGRGSTDPRDYGRQQYYAATSAEQWQSPTAEQGHFGAVPYYQHAQERRSPSESSEEEVALSPESTTIEPIGPQRNKSQSPTSSKPAKDKKYVCKRVASTGNTCYKAFARKADLHRHESCVHDKEKMVRLDCTFKKCGRKGDAGFLRKDHLTEHLRHFHGVDLPKRSRKSISGVQSQDDDDDIEDALGPDVRMDAGYRGRYLDDEYTGSQ